MFDFEVVPQLNFDDPDFGDLQRRSRASAFQHPLWMAALCDYAIKSGHQTLANLVVKHRESGVMVLVLPLVRRKVGWFNVLEFTNFGLVDYAAAVIDDAFWPQLSQMEDLALHVRRALEPYDLIWIKHVREQDLTLTALFDKPRVLPERFSAFCTELGDDFETWKKETLSSNRRSQIARKRRGLMKQGDVVFASVTDQVEVREVFDFLRVNRAERFQDRAGVDMLQLDAGFDFYLTLANSGISSEFALTHKLTVNGEMIAAIFGVIDKGQYHFLLSAADYERFGQYSPGQLMFDYLFEQMIARGLKKFDFSIGNEGYKKSFGTRSIRVFNVSKANSVAGRAGLSLISVLRDLKHLPYRRKIMSGD